MDKDFGDNQQSPGEEDGYEERPVPAFRHVPETEHPHPTGGNGGSKKWLLIAGIIAAALLVGGGAAYWFLLRKPAAPAKQQTTTASSDEQQNNASNPASTEPTTFKSTKLGMGVTYGNGWTLRENNDKSEVILTSPKTSYPRKDGTSTEGVFTIKMRHGVVPDATSATVQKSVAIRDSEVIGYTKPTGDQRQYTNVTYAGADANSFSFFIVSGNTAMKAGQAIGYNIDLIGDTYLIVGGFGADANDTLAFDPTAKDAITNSTFLQAMDIVKSVQID